MKVRVILTVDVDPNAYRDAYGNPDATLDDVREYVRWAAQGAAQSDLESIGADVSLAAENAKVTR